MGYKLLLVDGRREVVSDRKVGLLQLKCNPSEQRSHCTEMVGGRGRLLRGPGDGRGLLAEDMITDRSLQDSKTP